MTQPTGPLPIDTLADELADLVAYRFEASSDLRRALKEYDIGALKIDFSRKLRESINSISEFFQLRNELVRVKRDRSIAEQLNEELLAHVESYLALCESLLENAPDDEIAENLESRIVSAKEIVAKAKAVIDGTDERFKQSNGNGSAGKAAATSAKTRREG